MRARVMHVTSALLILTLVLIGTVAPAAAQGKPIRIGEINSYSGLATVYTFPYKEGLLMAAKAGPSSSSSVTTSSSRTRR